VPEIGGAPVTRLGDLWLLGEHRLLCGDARDGGALRQVMGGERARMVFTDPPYNVSVSSIRGRGRLKHREFVVASGEMRRAQFERFLVQVLSLAAKHSADGSIHFIFIDWRHLAEMLYAGEKVYTRRSVDSFFPPYFGEPAMLEECISDHGHEPASRSTTPRIIRLLEVLLHGGTHVGGWTAKQIHEAVLTTFGLSVRGYRLNQLRYDLRKLKGHALLERDGSRYAYRLTTKGLEVALLFLFFHKRLCGPLANSRFHHQPDARHRPDSRLEAAYHRADAAIQKVVDLLAAA
jgi:hypothetical protein